MIEAPQRQVRVNWERPIFTDNSGIPVKVSSNKLSGDLFDAPGSYEVSYTASDSSGNTNKDCTFRITLKRKLLLVRPFQLSNISHISYKH